jgi:hypothetical protein
VVLDKRFNDPFKAVTGGVQSNFVNGVVWFNIKPNNFISINDPNLEDTIRIRKKFVVFSKVQCAYEENVVFGKVCLMDTNFIFYMFI